AVVAGLLLPNRAFWVIKPGILSVQGVIWFNEQAIKGSTCSIFICLRMYLRGNCAVQPEQLNWYGICLLESR
ncbi:MAG: hypothetical protein KAV87_02750, partial [Desulfobacteraceae bacterium]|nr:hypothetical protein [Desulfobacteraceae bacterium]